MCMTDRNHECRKSLSTTIYCRRFEFCEGCSWKFKKTIADFSKLQPPTPDVYRSHYKSSSTVTPWLSISNWWRGWLMRIPASRWQHTSPRILTSEELLLAISSQLLMHRMKTSTIFFTVIFSTLRVIVYVTLKVGGRLLEALFYFPWNQFFCMVGLIDDLWNIIGRSNWFSKENRILHNRYLRYCYMECILI